MVMGSDAEPPSGQGTRSSRYCKLWEPPMPVDCSFGGANRLGEDHDKISTYRPSGGLVAGRSYVCHGSKWSTHWRISTSAVEPQSLWLLRLPSSLRLLSPPLLPSPSLLSSLLLALSFSELRVSVVAKGCRASDEASARQLRHVGRDPSRFIARELCGALRAHGAIGWE
jgi:hypothetical protein